MMLRDANVTEPTKRTLQAFAWFGAVMFLSLAIWHGIVQQRPVIGWYVGTLGGMFAFVGLLAPRALRPAFVVWTAALLPIRWLSSHLLLGLLFFGMFTPMACFFRLIGRDALRRRIEPRASSYWMSIPQHADAVSYFRQFS